MSKFFRTLKTIRSNESGATAIEYGLIAGLIAVVLITVLGLVGTDITAMFQSVADAI